MLLDKNISFVYICCLNWCDYCSVLFYSYCVNLHFCARYFTFVHMQAWECPGSHSMMQGLRCGVLCCCVVLYRSGSYTV